MTDFEIQVSGRISALEFVLEVMLANELAKYPEDVGEQVRADLVARPGYIRRGPVDVAELQAIEAETKAVLEHFCEKVATREAEIRGLK
jgi:hypothetical protein